MILHAKHDLFTYNQIQEYRMKELKLYFKVQIKLRIKLNNKNAIMKCDYKINCGLTYISHILDVYSSCKILPTCIGDISNESRFKKIQILTIKTMN